MNRAALFLKRCWRRAKGYLSSVNEIGFRGASLKRQTKNETRKLASEQTFLTPHDCGLILDLREDEVVALLESGHLSGLLIGRYWRVQPKNLSRFIRSRGEETRLAQMQAAIEDSATWARVCWEDEENARRIVAGNYPEGTFGRFLQEALQTHPPSSDVTIGRFVQNIERNR